MHAKFLKCASDRHSCRRALGTKTPQAPNFSDKAAACPAVGHGGAEQPGLWRDSGVQARPTAEGLEAWEVPCVTEGGPGCRRPARTEQRPLTAGRRCRGVGHAASPASSVPA